MKQLRGFINKMVALLGHVELAQHQICTPYGWVTCSCGKYVTWSISFLDFPRGIYDNPRLCDIVSSVQQLEAAVIEESGISCELRGSVVHLGYTLGAHSLLPSTPVHACHLPIKIHSSPRTGS